LIDFDGLTREEGGGEEKWKEKARSHGAQSTLLGVGVCPFCHIADKEKRRPLPACVLESFCGFAYA
jgi:hypothetical protein